MKKLLLIAILSISMFSCKKEKSPTPTVVTPSVSTIITHYQLTSTRQYDEAIDIYVYDNGGVQTTSQPIISAYADTMDLIFNKQVNGLPLFLSGNTSISSPNLIVSYAEQNMITSVWTTVSNAQYTLIP